MNKFFKSIMFVFFFMLFGASVVSAQEAVSNCVVTKIGGGLLNFVLPQECQQQTQEQPPMDGVLSAPLGPQSANHPGYYRMEPSTDGSYRFEAPSCNGQHFGSPLLINTLYTVAKNWKARYPQGHLNIGDLNAAGHKSHMWGRAVDLDATTNGRDWVAEYTKGNYNRAATIELGKLFVDTGKTANIWYNDQAVNSAVIAYANQTGKKIVMKFQAGHDNHFHVDVSLSPYLPVWLPGC